MTTAALERVFDRLRERAEHDANFAEALEHLAGDAVDDPFDRPGQATLTAARAINRARQRDRAEQLRARSLPTTEVIELIGSISDRKAVDRRRKRGRLLGIRLGRETLHPAWQFDRRRGDTHEGLDQVLAALREVVGDALGQDAIAVAPRADLDGRSVADVLAAGDVALAVRLVRLAGDQS